MTVKIEYQVPDDDTVLNTIAKFEYQIDVFKQLAAYPNLANFLNPNQFGSYFNHFNQKQIHTKSNNYVKPQSVA